MIFQLKKVKKKRDMIFPLRFKWKNQYEFHQSMGEYITVLRGKMIREKKEKEKVHTSQIKP